MSIELQPYWLPRPAYPINPELKNAFDDLLAKARTAGAEEPLEYTLEAPKWVFLCYAADQHHLALHGSVNPNIRIFEPRQPQDLNEFGAQLAVYAAADGIWPMYFAIVDRAHYSTILCNACIRIGYADGSLSHPYYLFSLDRHIVPQHPYCDGFIYLLPKETFVAEPPFPFGEVFVHAAQLASPVPVKPIARLSVSPDDFPFLSQMMAHEDERMEMYVQALRSGLPWPEPGTIV